MAATDPRTIIDAIDAKVLQIIEEGLYQAHQIAGHDTSRFSLGDIANLRRTYKSLAQSAAGGISRNLASLRGRL